MKKNKEVEGKIIGSDFIKRLGEEGWTYIKTVVDIVREPVLILGEDFRVMAANDPFYKMFQVKEKDTEGRIVYDLGNGQWNISALKKLLEDILPKNTFFKGFEVVHEFPNIGRKIMILNAREIHCKEDSVLGPCPPIILLAIEDITEMMDVADMLSLHTTQFEEKMASRTGVLENRIKQLEEEISLLIKRIKI
jgi:PAS domain-containing protein